MDDKELAHKAANSLILVNKLRVCSSGAKGELADLLNNAANRIEELTVLTFELTGEKKDEK